MITQPKTALEAIEAKSVSMVALKKESEIVSKAFLSFIITELVESFNVGKTMSDIQIAFAVNGIQGDYYFITIDELKYCFDQAKKGRYGTMYDRIDAAVIFEWIEKYLQERIEIFYNQNINQNSIHNSGVIHPSVAEKLLPLIKPIEKVDMSLVAPEKRERTKEEKFIQELFVEFDKLHRNKPYDPNESIKTIPYNGKNLSQSEFVQLRIEEELEKRNK